MEDLGRNIRSRRAGLGLTLEGLAERSGVSRAMLSEIERNAKNPTIKILAQIAAGLDCTVGQLIGEEAPPPPEPIEVVRVGEQRTSVDRASGLEKHQISPGFQRRGIEIAWCVIPAGGATGPLPPNQPGTGGHLTLIHGRLTVQAGDREVEVAAGESVFFRADLPHGYANPHQEPCHFFQVIDAGRPDTTPERGRRGEAPARTEPAAI